MSRARLQAAGAERSGAKLGAARRTAMPPHEREPKLRCPIALFEQVEPKMRSLTALINATSNVQDKAELARALMEQCETLLRCARFDESDMNCRLCRQFSTLRKKTAALVLKIAQAPRPNEEGAR